MASARKGIHKHNIKSLQRNRELRAVVLHVAAHPDSTIIQLAEKFVWSQSKARNAVESLVQVDLIYVSKKDVTVFKSAVHFFSVCEHTEDDLDTELPIKKPDGEVVAISNMASDGNVDKKRDIYGGWFSGGVRRDPLDLALMGKGIAPSILFHRSQDAAT